MNGLLTCWQSMWLMGEKDMHTYSLARKAWDGEH
jgi:hypothetical protein